jgi:peptidoglycan/xylan/chitin deacetylase (PgdA/CDA1 family)
MYRWLLIILLFGFSDKKEEGSSWIRINQLGYQPNGIKVAVWCGKRELGISNWELVDAVSKKIAYSGKPGKAFGAYGPFEQTYRLNFSAFNKSGRYYLQAGGARSPEFEIGENVYKGAADFCLRYMRQQRSGFNPFLKDSCHTHDGYVLYGEKAGIKDSTHIDVVGGWHDASDYLQYSTTSANATYHLLAAYRDFPNVFTDEKLANGLDGKNGLADVLDEAKWGLDWLLKMHPKDDWMFNQLGDDRDHMGMRIPKEDTNFYGKGLERPVYFVSGEPQQRGKFMNATTGTSSIAAKFSSAFALGSDIFFNEAINDRGGEKDRYAQKLSLKAHSAFNFSYKKPGTSQTASVRSPYIYAEDNWVDDMELGTLMYYKMRIPINPDLGVKYMDYIRSSYEWAKQEPITPWLGSDTAKHYQWYPFINLGHYELAKVLAQKKRDTIIGFYKQGIQLVWNKAKQNAFYRGIPFIWCSNNLTTSFAIQCYWYKQLTGDKTFDELEQANFDWLFGCNPWGTSMVYGLPSWGDTPVDPHSAFTHIKNYPIDGGLVDGPVYTTIYKNLIGINLYKPDEYEIFQSNLAVYHDDYGDYSTNEPTMDGTASLIYLRAAKEAAPSKSPPKGETSVQSSGKDFSYNHGGIIRGDSTKKNIALVFTGHEFAEGGDFIASTLQQQRIKASFFFTGYFYNNPSNEKLISRLLTSRNFLGNHSAKHLLYCDWNNRDSLLITKFDFLGDLFPLTETLGHLAERIEQPNYKPAFIKYFLPPYEWYNDSISTWCKEADIQLINYTPGTLSHADYTTSKDKNYRSSETIYNSIINYEKTKPAGLNGFVLLMHIGAGPGRTDKFYYRLPALIRYLKQKGYHFQTVDQLLPR